MKTMNHVFNSVKLIAFCATVLLIQSCDNEKESALTVEEEVEIANNSSSAEITLEEDIQSFEDIIADTESANGRVTESCVEVIRNAEAKTISLDFGEGCVGPYGRERSGKVIVTYGGEFGDNQANRIITFEDYVVNNKEITGKIGLRNFNLNQEDNITHTRKLDGYTVHFPGGSSIELNGSVTVEWIEGGSDNNRWNDVLSMTGGYTGRSTRGREIIFTILEPVIASFPCRAEGSFLRVDGKTELKISAPRRSRIRTVDYGDGTCDNTIVITINNKVFNLTLS